MDLAQWVADGRWVALLELIDELPSASRLWAKIVDDPEAAEELLYMEQQREADQDAEHREPWAPPFEEFNLANMLTVEVINELKALRQSGQAVAGAKPRKEEPFPKPRTAVDRLREKLDNEAVQQIAFDFGFTDEDFK